MATLQLHTCYEPSAAFQATAITSKRGLTALSECFIVHGDSAVNNSPLPAWQATRETSLIKGTSVQETFWPGMVAVVRAIA